MVLALKVLCPGNPTDPRQCYHIPFILSTHFKKKKKKITEQLSCAGHCTEHWRIKKYFDKVPDPEEFTQYYVQKDTNTQQKNLVNDISEQSSNVIMSSIIEKKIEHTTQYITSINYTHVHNNKELKLYDTAKCQALF